MDSSSIAFAASPSAPASGAAPSPASGGGDPVRGADFANLFKHLMDPVGRQDLAADGQGRFQSLPLSPNIEVITADQPLPDSDSLLAFARSQGLDDAMLQSLFQPPGAAALAAAALTASGLTTAGLTTAGLTAPGPTAPGPTAPGLTTAGLPPPGLTDPALLAGMSAQMSLQMSVQVSAQVPAQTAADPSLSDPAAVALPAAGLPLLAAAGQGASLPVLPVLPMAAASPTVAALPTAAALPGDARAAALAFGPHVQALTGDAGQAQPAGLRFMGAGAGVAAAAPVLAATAQESADAAQPAQAHLLVQSGPGSRLLKSPSAAELAALAAGKLEPESAQATEQTAASQAGRQLLQDTLKLRLKPLEGITQRLAAMAGTGEQVLWARISGQAAAPLEALALGLGEEGALGAGLNSEAEALPTAGHGSAHSSAHASVRNAVAAEAQQAASTAGERVAQYEQLAQRLGRALGERLQAQIERGEWKVRMQVDPASLGRIEMELDMRAGGLDAVFRSDNQLTRELINQSLPRLRETLAQSGTAVANVWVQGDSSRQSGGNPTPGREGRPERGLGRPEAGEPAALVEASRPRRDASAWDLLA